MARLTDVTGPSFFSALKLWLISFSPGFTSIEVTIDMSHSTFKTILYGIRGRCPECHKGKLFKGFISLDKRCSVCGLDYEFADSGDGPAIFIMFIVGFVIVAAAIWTEIAFRPPYWVHAVLWVPGILILSAGLLRPFKGLLIALQHKHQAREGQIDR